MKLIIKLNDTVYNVLKWVVVICLPAIATLYSGLSAVWGWPYSEEVVKTIAASELFLGTVLGISSANYKSEKSASSDAEKSAQ